jgi:cell division inhibitor SepF
MVENLLRRAKNFIGLGEEGLVADEPVRQIELRHPSKKERKQGNLEEGEYEVVIYEPKVYEDSLSISQQLRTGNPVLINLRHLEPQEGTRLIDFVCGTAYAIDGHMLKIAEAIFLFTPKHIFITDVAGRMALEDEEEDKPRTSGNKFFSRG